MKPQDSIQQLKGIGEKKAQRYRKLHIQTLRDLAFHFPMRYEDRTVFKPLDQIAHDERVCGYGTIVNFEHSRPKRNLEIIKILVKQGNHGATLTMFNNRYIMDRFSVGDSIAFYGKAKLVFGRLEFSAPEIERYGANRLTGCIYPVYPLTAGITNSEISDAIRRALAALPLDEMELLPESLLRQNQLAPLPHALMSLHAPQSMQALRSARYRFVYEELFLLQLYILTLKAGRAEQHAYPIASDLRLAQLLQSLPYTLTDAQQSVITEIEQDLAQATPMQRLVQGDVGSGKTIVAFAAIYLTALAGFQSALMVPTELLAKQHFASACALLEPLGLRVRLLVGSTPKKEKEEIYGALSDGTCDLVIGTHALIEDKVRFARLALAVTDEQHRFGVRQRSALYNQYETVPHVLVLTATPIPRTLSLIIQGDLEVSRITQMPAGRVPIETLVYEQKLRHKAYERCKQELDQGKQIYIVCPLIEESEELDLSSAQELYLELSEQFFQDYTVGLLHGKMRPAEKASVMQDFERGEIQVLVSTTVIEVGINVPNATVMIIEEAQRFGLAQLHQLRGRVGRGSDQSYCMLIYRGGSDLIQQRMQIMNETTDGFLIAEKDLLLRGPGELFGLKQHGLPELRIADLARHISVMEQAQDDVRKILSGALLTESERTHLIQTVADQFRKKLEEIALN